MTDYNDPILGTLGRDMARKALGYAEGRAITCPECGDILDQRRAVLVTSTGPTARCGIACARCHDATIARVCVKHNITAERAHALLQDSGTDVDDGRKLWPGGK